MTLDKSDRESHKFTTDLIGDEDKINKDDKNEDWMAELEHELQELEKKWPSSGNFR